MIQCLQESIAAWGKTCWLQMRASQCKQTLCTHVVLQTDMQTHAWSPTPRWKTQSRMADLIWPDLRRETLIYRKCKLNILRLIISSQTDKCRRSKQQKCPNSTTLLHTQHPTVFQLARWGGSSNNMTGRFWNYFWYWISKQGCGLLQWLHTR